MASGKAASKTSTFIDTKYVPLDKKIKLIVCIVLFLLPPILFYFFFYSPNVEKIEGLQVQKKGLIAEIEKAKKAASELDAIKAAIAETEELFKETAKLLPKSKEIPALLRNISDLGKGAGLDFNTFRPGAESPREFYSEIPVSIVVDGPYHNMGFFLDKVSKLERIVTVDNIQMGSPVKEGGEMILKSNCRLMTYRFTGVETNK